MLILLISSISIFFSCKKDETKSELSQFTYGGKQYKIDSTFYFYQGGSYSQIYMTSSRTNPDAPLLGIGLSPASLDGLTVGTYTYQSDNFGFDAVLFIGAELHYATAGTITVSKENNSYKIIYTLTTDVGIITGMNKQSFTIQDVADRFELGINRYEVIGNSAVYTNNTTIVGFFTSKTNNYPSYIITFTPGNINKINKGTYNCKGNLYGFDAYIALSETEKVEITNGTIIVEELDTPSQYIIKTSATSVKGNVSSYYWGTITISTIPKSNMLIGNNIIPESLFYNRINNQTTFNRNNLVAHKPIIKK